MKIDEDSVYRLELLSTVYFPTAPSSSPIHPTQLLLVASACITVPLIYMPGIGKGGSQFHGVPLGEHGCSNKLGVHAYMGLVLPICLIILQSMSGMGPANYVK